MKFLCVECDSSMALSETKGPDNGSMTVIFTCRSCERQIAMLTNAQETQMVHSLGVKIGGRKEAAPPMETIRGSLVGAAGDGAGTHAPNAPHATATPHAPAPSDSEPAAEESDSAGKCPFSAMVTEGMEGQIPAVEGIRWTAEAEARLTNIPSFIRSMVKRGIEDHAKAQGIEVIDPEVMASVRGDIGM